MIATKAGYGPATASVDVVAGQQRDLRIVLTPNPAEQEQPTVVASTRIPRRLEEQAIPVEVIGRTRVEENMFMTPGNIAMLLDGMRSVRAQSTSPELGLTMLRIRGLRGSTRGCSPTVCRSTGIVPAGSRRCRSRRWTSPRWKC